MSGDAIRDKYEQFVSSDAFIEQWWRWNPKPRIRYVLALLLLAVPGGILLGIGLVISGILRQRTLNRLLRREAEIAATGRPMRCAIVMHNIHLRDGPGVNDPALVMGSFQGELPEDMAAEITIKALTDAQEDSGPITPPDIRWLNDETYVEDRRRRLPPALTGNLEVFVFDLMVHTDWLAHHQLGGDIWVMATPGDAGFVRQIPHQVLLDAGHVAGPEADGDADKQALW